MFLKCDDFSPSNLIIDVVSKQYDINYRVLGCCNRGVRCVVISVRNGIVSYEL